MTVTMRPSWRAEHVRGPLEEARNRLQNVRSSTYAMDAYNAYLRWAGEQQRVLGSYLSRESIARLIATDHYRTLCMLDPAGKGNELRSVVEIEIERQLEEFDAAIRELDAATARHADADLVLVPDTNTYLHHDVSFESIPWSDLAQDGAALIQLAVPLLVIDELDKAKRLNTRVRPDGEEMVRGRARRTLRALEAQFGDGETFEFDTASAVRTLAVFVPEEPGHARLPRPDDELVDVASGIAAFARGRVTVVSSDTGLRLRARLAGLAAVAPPGSAPPD